LSAAFLRLVAEVASNVSKRFAAAVVSLRAFTDRLIIEHAGILPLPAKRHLSGFRGAFDGSMQHHLM
jgi:hypothetical protein